MVGETLRRCLWNADDDACAAHVIILLVRQTRSRSAERWQPAFKVMETQDKGGVIVNTASVGGLFGTRGGAAYTASKHGLKALQAAVGTVNEENLKILRLASDDSDFVNGIVLADDGGWTAR